MQTITNIFTEIWDYIKINILTQPGKEGHLDIPAMLSSRQVLGKHTVNPVF